MSEDVVRTELARLSKLFNMKVTLKSDYRAKFDSGEEVGFISDLAWAWKIDTNIAAIDWGEEAVHGAFPVWAHGRTAEETLAKFKAKLVDKPTGFLLSTHTYGYRFADINNRGPHIVQHWKGDVMIEEFPFDEEKVLALLKETNPKPEAVPA